MKVLVRSLQAADGEAFVAAARRSRRLHAPWVSAPRDEAAFERHCARFTAPANHAFVVCTEPGGQLAGAIHLTNVVLGAFCSGYLGYYAFDGFQGRGCMKRGLQAVARRAFTDLKLHRLEANIQPGNLASIALVRACGFQLEGHSPRYLKIGGRWRDHERWALLRD
jgi:ribosomal-protein-alanine N-acetyltransferase